MKIMVTAGSSTVVGDGNWVEHVGHRITAEGIPPDTFVGYAISNTVATLVDWWYRPVMVTRSGVGLDAVLSDDHWVRQ